MAAPEEKILDGIPPAFRFRPTPRELVEFYLLPRARGQNPFPGIIIEDDAAGSSLPRDLFARHGLGGENEAYFLVRSATDAKKPGGARRQNRSCGGAAGGACWKMQSSSEKGLRVGGEMIQCRRSNLNLHMGKGKDGGSVGWVMHEYTIVSPPCPSQVKICHIAFSGHGQKRKRVPDEHEECQSEDVPQSQRARVDATAAVGCSSSGGMPDPDSGAVVYTSADDEEHSQSPIVGSSEILGFPSTASANVEQYQDLEQQVPSTEQEQQVMMPQSMAQQSTMAEPEQLSAAELEFWSSIGVHVQSSSCAEQELWSSNGVNRNVMVPRIGDFLGFPSAASANAEQCQELEQQMPMTEEEQVMVPQLMSQQSTNSEMEQLAGEVEFLRSTAVDVQSNNCVEQELWSSNGVDSNAVVPRISDILGFPSATSANAGQCQELEQQVPGTEEQQVPGTAEQQVMMPQLMGQQSSVPGQLSAGELEFWSSIGVNDQSNNIAEQEFWSLTGFESNSMAPSIDIIAGDHQGQQDFWSLSRADVQSNCAVPDMATGAIVGTHWGGYSIFC